MITEPQSRPERSARLKFVSWWLLISLIAAGACSLKWPSAHLGAEYIPAGMDAFYHARRILDAAADPSAFYEFDPKIHAPEGSLLTWPWGYDYAMGWLVRAGGAIGIPGTPIAILIWIPVAAVLVPIGLMMLIGRRLGLSHPFMVIAALATALSPLTQYLHGVGQVDHHFAEYIFVLATIACGLKWFSRTDEVSAAIVLGAVLGAAPAIHNGLFILQLPVLATMLIFWLQGRRLPTRTTLLFSASLLATTLAILLPSLPFRLGHFEFYTLSWFHLYVAAGSAVVSVALAGLAKSKRSIAILAITALLLLIPLAHQTLIARAFLTGTIKRLDTIVEMHALSSLAMSIGGARDLTLMYSLLVWLTPVTVIFCGWCAWQERATERVFFWVSCILGLALMITQLRMHYFGSFALCLPLLVLAEAWAQQRVSRRKIIVLSTALLFVVAFAPSVRFQLGAVPPPAGDSSFRALRPILEDLRQACVRDPGIVLADNDAGHYIRYYTECSVIANNFLLTRQHEEKIRQIDYLTSLPASALPGAAPYVRYVLLRPVSVFGGEKEVRYMSYSQISGQLINDLLLQPLERVPTNYRLIEQASLGGVAKEGVVPYIRLFEIETPQLVEAPASPKAAAN